MILPTYSLPTYSPLFFSNDLRQALVDARGGKCRWIIIENDRSIKDQIIVKQKRGYFIQEEESGVFCEEVLVVIKYR